jgi:hypothetical protein
MMNSPSFLLQKWPRRHEHLVEECLARGRALHVSEVLPYLTGYHRELISRWNPPTHPWLTLVPRMGGPFRRWWFVCPRCQRLREALYVPPGVQWEEWRCRICWDLIYASQRYGQRHPLRKKLTHRKKVTMRKEVLRQQRQWARRQSRLSVVDAATVGAEDEPWITEAVERVREHVASREAEATAVQARIAEIAGRALGACRELATAADSKRVRAGARRALARYERRLGVQLPVQPAGVSASRPAATLSAADVERLMYVLTEDESVGS